MTEKETLELDRMHAENKRMLAETTKLFDEAAKLRSEERLNGKKIRWFEMTVGISIFALGIAFAKLFL